MHPLEAEARARNLDPTFVIARMRHTSFVSRRHGYIYISVPKAACTKVKHLVTAVEGSKLYIGNKPYLRETRVAMLVHQRGSVDVPTVLDMNAEEIRDLVSGKSKYFVFALVRNPYSRLVSIFENKVRLHEPGFRRAGQLWGASEAGADVCAAFAGFIRDGLPYYRDQIGDHHFVLQRRLLIPDLIPYSRYFRVEQFSEFEAVFFALLREKGYTGPLEVTDHNRSHHPDWRYYYDEETARRVGKMYRADFDTYGYDIESWRLEGELPELRTTAEESYWRRAIIGRNEMIDYLHNHLQTPTS